ncbi:transducin family protein / WD-40 repeat family protein [Artemisia annua]|uniref:Transducin family protein / WD-40 repeat family protein n=1 Tax=Artemisia annua TaxID=35608 RepID=A0A2U1NJQ5_ARTAN|nr:transducin family protein / WD-40 repeat family protein [Artemisia annua]
MASNRGKEIIPISSDSSIEPSYDHVQPLSWEDYFPKDYDPKDYFPSAKRVESSTTLTPKQEEKLEFATRKKVLGLPCPKTYKDFDVKSFVKKEPKDLKGKGFYRSALLELATFLDEEKFKETVHKLEQESGFFFNMKHDRSKGVEILVKDLKVFASFNEELFKEITQLLTLENFRENEQLSKYGDTKSARAIMLVELKKLIEANPLFRDKLQFPNLKNSRLRTLINQSLNWQHQLCKTPRPNPDIKTLFVDHSCGQPNGARAPSPANNPLLGALPKAGGFPPLGAHGPFQPTQAPVPAPLAGWMSNPPAMSHPAVSGSAIGLGGPSMPAALKHPRTPPTNPSLDFPSVGDSDHASKRTRTMGLTDEVNLPVNALPVSFPGHASHSQAFNPTDDLPKNVARILNQGSSPMSMDFHPIQQTLLLVCDNNELWFINPVHQLEQMSGTLDCGKLVQEIN